MTASLTSRSFNNLFLSNGTVLFDLPYTYQQHGQEGAVAIADGLGDTAESYDDPQADWRAFSEGRKTDQLEKIAGVSKQARNRLVADEQLAAAMLTTAHALRLYFPGHTFTIEPQEDPYGVSKNLILSVHTSFGWEEAVKRLEEFDDSFWLVSGYVAADFFVHLRYDLV
jgi:hypothetical protein